MDDIIKKYRIDLEIKCEEFYNQYLSIPSQEFDWSYNAILWFGSLVKEGEKILNKMQYQLYTTEFNLLSKLLQTISEEQFARLKLRIDQEKNS